MTVTSVYAGVDQADLADLTTTVGAVIDTFRCFSWRSAAGRVEASVHRDGEEGQIVYILGGVVASAIADDVDCPRVLAVANRYFIIEWIDVDEGVVEGDPIVAGAVLYRARFDITDPAAGWTNLGSVAIYTTCQYDHAVVIGTSDFIVSRRTGATDITTTRYTAPYTWIDTVWSEVDAHLVIADTVLGCYAHSGDNDVLVSYQDTLLLRTFRRNASNGASFNTSETFADLLDGDNHFTIVRHERTATGTYLVLVEACPEDQHTIGGYPTHLRLVGWREILGSSTAVRHESQWLLNCSILAGPWSWASGTPVGLEIYVAVAFKSVSDGDEFAQQCGYVVRLDVAALPGANAAGVVRAIPVSAIMSGTIDARPHGVGPIGNTLVSIGARCNHTSRISGPPQYTLGPDRKSVMWAHIRWSRLARSQDADAVLGELQPVEAGVGFGKFFHEDPWTVARDTKEPTQPDTPSWRGVARTMALPVETPAGLVWTGGITTCYDGRWIGELGYLWTPEILAVTAAESGGEMDVAEEYHWYVNLAWPDARGQLHRGPPSRPVSETIGVDEYATLRIRMLNLSMKDDRRRYPLNQRIYIEVWRTTATGAGDFETDTDGTTVSYLFRSEFGGPDPGWTLQDLPANDHEEFYLDVVVGRSNAVVRFNELAPFQLNLTTLQWTPPTPTPHQPLNVARLWQNRLFGVDPETGLMRWTEEILPDGTQYRAPEFLDENSFRLDGLGEPTALAALDNDLAILTRDGVYSLAGNPGAGGSGSSFNLRTIARGTGCIEPRSVCVFTDGATFQSARGLMVLTRGAGLENIGAPIEDMIRDAGNVRSAVLLEDRHQIRFTFDALPGTGPLTMRPRTATYDYRAKLWSIRYFPMVAQSSVSSRLNGMQHACSWRGLSGEALHLVLFQGALARERSDDDTVYGDVNSAGTTVAIPLDVTTEWIHMGLPDSTKLWPEIGILTERTQAGPLTIEAWFDHDGSYDSDLGAAEQTLTIASPAPPFIRFRPRPFKARAIKLRIYEPSSAAATENVRFVALIPHWAIKPKRQGSRNSAA